MKHNKLLIIIVCFALSFALLLGGTLVLMLSPRTSPNAPPSEESTTPEQETEPPVQTVDPAVQNKLLISAEDFKDPAAEYRALEIVHDFLSLPGETMEDKVASLKEYGFGGAATNMKWDGGYLQQGHTLDLLGSFVSEAHKQGVRIWLYDEYGYPSGSAGNLTVKDHPEYAAVRSVQVKLSGNGPETRTANLPQGFIKIDSALLKTGSTYTPFTPTVENGVISVTGTEGAWTAYVYCVEQYCYGFEWNSSYPNILNRDAVARFIEVTFDTYEGAIENFDEVVEAIFDDEAQLLATHHIMPNGLICPVLPYDYDIFETFEAKYGYDARPLLPLIYSGDSPEAMRVRAHFYSHVGDLVSENFFGQIQDWCEEHGTQLSGHLLLEEQMFYHVPVYGDYIQSSMNMGYSGFDVLNVRPKPYLEQMSTGGKYASSPAWLSGKERVMIEIAPAADPDEFATNHLDYALGAMTFAYFDGGNQITSYYGQSHSDKETGKIFNEYVGRMGSLTVGAQNTTQIAIYYAIDTAAASYEAPTSQNLYSASDWAKKNDTLVGRLATGLRRVGLDYVFLDDASMQGGTVSAGGLQVGSFTFTTVIVPNATVMDIKSMRVLDALIEQGVNVIFVESMPSLAFFEADQAELEALSAKHSSLLCAKFSDAVSAVTTEVKLKVSSKLKYVYVSPYQKDGTEFFFLACNAQKPIEVKLSYPDAIGYRIYDPVSGEIYEVENTATVQSFRALFVQPLLPEA